MQHFLKAVSGAAWTKVLTTELFYKLFVSMHDPKTALYLCFGRESLTAFTAPRERKAGWRVRLGVSWHASRLRSLDLTTISILSDHEEIATWRQKQAP